jgi:hypothetical protein
VLRNRNTPQPRPYISLIELIFIEGVIHIASPRRPLYLAPRLTFFSRHQGRVEQIARDARLKI